MGVETKLLTPATRTRPPFDEAHLAQSGLKQPSAAEASVRERPEPQGGHSSASPGPSHLAHRRQSFPLTLNENWRVVDNPLQWIVQQRKGNRRGKNTGWRGRLFFRTRSGLLSRLKEYCGDVDPQARAMLEAFPEWHR